ncbi:MAG TPA: THUMP domain-containing protein [bacterium]|nr:THUMP domain-containing protein [bacterium]HPJ72055.1 THUMP domain-containing protein [bacterium]
MYHYQETDTYFAQTAEEVKDIAQAELRALGAVETRSDYRGIHFSAPPKNFYAINYRGRLFSRVLAPLTVFWCRSERDLYRGAAAIAWEDFLDPGRTFAVSASVSRSCVKHSRYAALRVKDAVVDYFRERTGKRPAVDTRNPDVGVHLYLAGNKATLSVDASGGSLHRRGYRHDGLTAPMAETVAAAVLAYAEWEGETPLYDPFCGSGTILCEAYMRASKIPAGFLRPSFGFERFPDFDADLWRTVREEAESGIRPVAPGAVSGSDVSPDAVRAALRNCSAIDPEGRVKIVESDVFDLEGLENTTIVCNPPYGLRLGKGADLGNFYRRLGDFLKQRCRGATAYIYFGNREFIKNIGLKPSWKRLLVSGGLEGRLAKYELY